MRATASDHSQARGDDDDAPKETVAATLRKIDHFSDKLFAIRRQLAAGERMGYNTPLLPTQAAVGPLWMGNNGVVARSELEGVAADPMSSDAYDPIRLPSLPNAMRPPRASEPMPDGLLSMDSLRSRAAAQSQYDTAQERLLQAEEDAARAVQEAERLTEEARIAMVLYSQNEKGWNFDERARRYQHVTQAKKVADAARLKADDDRVLVRYLRTQLADPYALLRACSDDTRNKASFTAALEPIRLPSHETVLVWILASPLLTLPFTPRTSKPGATLLAEKELSTHVVYYAAASDRTDYNHDVGECDEDVPPTTDWHCCSSHGLPPSPNVTPVRSSIESWLVSGAGATHVNGSYLFNGTHGGTRKFKNTAGVELFRKELPRTSSLIRGLLEALAESSKNTFRAATPLTSQYQLTSNLQVLELHDHNFKAMGKIGAWMSAEVLQQNRQRLRDMESFTQTKAFDGRHIHKQEAIANRRGVHDLMDSRKEASADLCREWVLFMHCHRRVDQIHPSDHRKHVGLGCLKRHYYVCMKEKDEMIAWAQEEEAWLEKDVLLTIIKREAHLERLQRFCHECMSSFQQDLPEETKIEVNKVLKELNTVRFLTVRVLEVIDSWRSHARKRGYLRYEADVDRAARPSVSEWSACITIDTGRKLYDGSHAFQSKFKRFCRPEDPHGRHEQRIVYLGLFPTRDAAEVAYDDFVNAEARRLNTTVNHLPRRRSVIRSCGKHFAVESERLGPDYCIECSAKQLSGAGVSRDVGGGRVDEWSPPFCFPSGQNYILKLASDLDFLGQVTPVKHRLNSVLDSLNLESFPLLGNVFLLPRTPIEDPSLAFFASFRASGRNMSVSYVRSSDNTNQLEEDEDILEETLSIERVLGAQKIFLQELQIYHPELFSQEGESKQSNQSRTHVPIRLVQSDPDARRVVQALYWDRCAALRIRQQRSPLPYRQNGVWCRPDLGEWAGLLVRGKHQQHLLFENRLIKAGKEMNKRRKNALKIIRKLLKTPLYLVPSRDVILAVITECELLRGDVVMLEVKSAHRFLEKYDLWKAKVLVLQRCYRGFLGRRRTRATRRALHLASLTRRRYLGQVNNSSRILYTEHIVPKALQVAILKLQQPAYTQIAKIDCEQVIVCIHSTNTVSVPRDRLKSHHPIVSFGCVSCRRVYRSTATYDASGSAFGIINSVCCCKLTSETRSPSESWIVRAYNPSNSIIYRLIIGNNALVQLLHPRTAPTNARGILDVQFNPLTTCKSLSESLKGATTYSNYICALASTKYKDSENWRVLSDEAVQRRKTAEADLERANQQVVLLAKRYDVAVVDAQRALDFTCRPFNEAQAWDPLENANDWRLLVSKRHTQKDLQSATDNANQCCFELFQANATEKYVRAQGSHARARYDSVWRRIITQQHAVVNARAIELETTLETITCAMRKLCTNQLALRDAFYAPTRRVLNVAPAIWRRDDSSMSLVLSIDLPGLQRGRNILRRKAILLTERTTNESMGRRQRLIVDVSSWAKTSASGIDGAANFWVSAYDPMAGKKQCIYLEWELIQLLARAPVIRLSGTSERTRRLRIADKLLSLCMLDRFTGEFTLQKLHFFHHLRQLRPHFLASRWFQDLKRGRKCGDGDEIYRQSTTINGKLCFVVVYENWGDLVVRVYRSSDSKCYRILIEIHSVFKLLSSRPLMLHLWVCCVKSNQYVPLIISVILSGLRFTQGGEDLIMLEPTELLRESKPMCISTIIQNRRVILKYHDTVGGDLRVTAFDISENRSFKLHLEWETVRRALRGIDVDDSKPRRRNLTLTRNRREMCEWITSRLRFQRLLEHPDVLASSCSPLVSGAQVRVTFSMFNDWVLKSTRNPLSAMSGSDVDRIASSSDALLFHGLAYEQLAFVNEPRLACSNDKLWMGTQDFAVNLPSTVTGNKILKVDFYFKTHHVFARVRREVQAEVMRRNECAEIQRLEIEEALSLASETEFLSTSTHVEVVRSLTELRDLLALVSTRRTAFGQVYLELIKRTRKLQNARTRDRERIQRKTSPFNPVEHVSVKCIASRMLSALRSRENLAFEILMRQSLGLIGTLSVLEQHVAQITVYLEEHVHIPLQAFISRALARLGHTTALSALRDSWCELHHLRRSFRQVESIAAENDDKTARSIVEDEALSSTGHSAQDFGEFVSFIMPPSGPIEQVYLHFNSRDARSFCMRDATLVEEVSTVLSHVERWRDAQKASHLHAKRVPCGIVFFSEQASAFTHPIEWNPRASALAQELVSGPAVFVTKASWSRVLQEVDSVYQSLSSLMLNVPLGHAKPPFGLIGDAKRHVGQRPKQLLSWKQFSVERMQTARKVSQQRSRQALLLRPLDADNEREQMTLAACSIDRFHAEWMCGSDHISRLDSTALSTLSKCLLLAKDKHIRWSLLLRDETQIQLFMDDDRQMALNPSDVPDKVIQPEHIRVHADNWQHTRRLIFSCRELQSRRSYFLDCSCFQLHKLLGARNDETVMKPHIRLPVTEWRRLALEAAKELKFTQRNGSLCLSFPGKTLGMGGFVRGHSANETAEVVRTVSPATPLKQNDYKMREAARFCTSRRYLKQLVQLRYETVARQVNEMRDELTKHCLPLEWLRMTQEDLKSQELRGMLVLEDKGLKKLKEAFGRVHIRRLGSSDLSSEVGAILMCIDKEMGAKDKQSDPATKYQQEAMHFLSTVRGMKWWREKHRGEQLQLDFADIAQWWQWRRRD